MEWSLYNKSYAETIKKRANDLFSCPWDNLNMMLYNILYDDRVIILD